MDIAGTFALQNNFSILELFVEDLSKNEALLQGMPFTSMIREKIGVPLLGRSGCWANGR